MMNTLFTTFITHSSPVRRALSVHLMGYLFRQKMYEEVFNNDTLLKHVAEFSQTHLVQNLWYLPLFLLLAAQDTAQKSKYDKLKDHPHLNVPVAVFECLLWAALFIFAKDVESVS